ncbi:DNA-binding protein [Southern Psittacara leucophthalmus aviadenovirus]|uniref:DNA-binding protein n=1 Tax=Southern Psittacara leucophthalmus aviadenovirus TaxID=2604330 RepID=A0AAF1DB83_9ADEN|nr:DNA-binding protein [Southern Psittacara leucophthalmus aviadenovirus]QEJ80776.1 DNA-binding protein [Southern Psittacara leucophthalmus aviadenovirus]
MAQFLDLEAVESGAEELYSGTSGSEDEEVLAVSGKTRPGASGKKPKTIRDRAKGLAKKLHQISSDEEEEIQQESAPARGELDATRRRGGRAVCWVAFRGGPVTGVCNTVSVTRAVSGRAAAYGREPFKTGRKAPQKRAKTAHQISSDSDDPKEESVQPSTVTGSHCNPSKMAGKKRAAVAANDSLPAKKQQKTDEKNKNQMEVDSDNEEEVEQTNPSSPNPPQDPITYNSQKAMGMLEKICDSLDIKWQGYDIKPDSAIWSKIGGVYMRKKHSDYRLTFSAFDSYHTQIGRFLAAMVYAKTGLEPKFLPGGAFVWRHGWFEDGEEPKCLHGQELVLKPRTVELNPSSEQGRRAIAEQNAAIEKNRYGRQVVVIRFDNNAVCYKDKDHQGFPHPHAHGSCAVVFSDLQKAVSAMKHDIEWTMALYPNADKKRASECVLICGSCNCNYAADVPITGRQLPKMTPYKLSGIDDITRDMCKARKDMQAHKNHPHTMVFTCCNPQSTGVGGRGGSKGKNDKSCSWRLSAMDLRYAYVIANEIYGTVFGKTVPANLQQFKWSDSFAFKTEVITPINPLDSQDPFA